MTSSASLAAGFFVAATLVAAVHGAGSAHASFPGTNGRIAFSSDLGCGGFNAGDIVVVNAKGNGQTNLTNTPDDDDSSPTWSADGRRIAFTTDLDFPHTRQIVSMNADGTGRASLVGGEFVGTPAWSPDGMAIAYSDFEIFVMNADGSGKTRLTRNRGDGTQFDRAPDWSPNGTKIAFSREDLDGDGEIFAINADGSAETNLTNDAQARNSSPSWSPDGTRIAFSSYRNNFEIFVMNADGSGRTNVTNNPAADDSPEWSPDGTKIASTAGLEGSTRSSS